MNIHSILLAAALFGAATNAVAEEQTSATIDGHAITVKYAQPAANKRIVGTLQADADIAFKGVRVPKGTYTISVMTDGPQWHLMLSKANSPKDLGHVVMTMSKGVATPACKITLTKIAALAAKLEVAWNGTIASAPFHLDRGGTDTEW